jgi:hypothetical protein
MRGRVFHTLVEVIDARRGELIASREFPFHAVASTRAGELVIYRQDEAGTPFVDVWRVELTGHRP